LRRLTNVTALAGSFSYDYYPGPGGLNTASSLIRKLTLPGGSYITNAFDEAGRLTGTHLDTSAGAPLNSHVYV
jgi:hypothetical protein